MWLALQFQDCVHLLGSYHFTLQRSEAVVIFSVVVPMWSSVIHQLSEYVCISLISDLCLIACDNERPYECSVGVGYVTAVGQIKDISVWRSPVRQLDDETTHVIRRQRVSLLNSRGLPTTEMDPMKRGIWLHREQTVSNHPILSAMP